MRGSFYDPVFSEHSSKGAQAAWTTVVLARHASQVGVGCRECRHFRLRSGAGGRIVAAKQHGAESTFAPRVRAMCRRGRHIALVKA